MFLYDLILVGRVIVLNNCLSSIKNNVAIVTNMLETFFLIVYHLLKFFYSLSVRLSLDCDSFSYCTPFMVGGQLCGIRSRYILIFFLLTNLSLEGFYLLLSSMFIRTTISCFFYDLTCF